MILIHYLKEALGGLARVGAGKGQENQAFLLGLFRARRALSPAGPRRDFLCRPVGSPCPNFGHDLAVGKPFSLIGMIVSKPQGVYNDPRPFLGRSDCPKEGKLYEISLDKEGNLCYRCR